MKDKENNAMDFGEWVIPDSWDKISLKIFQEIQNHYDSISGGTGFDIREVLHILCNKSIDEINALPSEFLDMILDKLQFLQKQPKQDEPRNFIVIDGEKYTIHFENTLKTGELIASDSLIKSDPNNLAALLGILCRKDGELYDSKFENEILEGRITLFEKQPVMKVLPLVSFFLLNYIALGSISQLCTKVEEGIKLTQQNIDSSQRIGLCKKWYLTWQMARLRKRLESTRHMQGTSSSILHTSSKKARWKKLNRNFKTILGKLRKENNRDGN